jgi:PAS domain-containing protein
MLVSVALDITERRRSAEEAHASRSKLEAALAAMTEAVFICDTKGCFIHFNDAFAKFHKFKSKDDCAKTFNEYPAFLDFFWPVETGYRGKSGLPRGRSAAKPGCYLNTSSSGEAAKPMWAAIISPPSATRTGK